MKVAPAVLVAVFATLTVGCGHAPEAQDRPAVPRTTGTWAAPDLSAPELSAAEPAARAQIEARQQALRELETRGGEPAALSQAYGDLGQLYHAYGFGDAALGCYHEAARRSPTEPRWLYLAAVLEQQAGRAGEARALLEKAAALAPRAGAVELRLAHLLLEANHPAEARRAFERARAAGPEFELAARLGVGRAAALLGAREEAIAELEAVVAAAPKAGKARYALALVLRDAGRVEEARKLLEQSTSGEVSAPDPWLEAATAAAKGSGASMRQGGEALMAGRLAEAEAAFRQAVETDPGYTEARRNLALTLGRQGKNAEAESTLAEASRLAPSDAGVLFDWGNSLLALGDREGAITRFERALAVAPDYTAARFNLANTLIAAGRWEPAMVHLRTLVAANPADPKPRYLLAMGFAQRGELAEAERRLLALLAEDSKNVPALEGLAQVQMAARKLEAAVETFEAALALADNPASFSGLATALSQAGRHREARQRLEQGLAAKAGETATELALSLSLARLLATCPDEKLRDGKRALELAQRVYQSQPSLPAAETLAQALAAAGEVAKAAEVQQALVIRVQQSGDLVTARRLAGDLAQYLAGKAIFRPLS